MSSEISIRPLRENDLIEADRIVRLAFGTFLGLPDPLSFMGDAAYVQPRWMADPSGAFAAEIGGELAGSSFATNWGSFGFFGPLTVRPDFWDRGVAKRLMEAMMGCFTRWETRHAGLFTFANSLKHVGLYQKFGFWPRFLTAIMSKPVGSGRSDTPLQRFSGIANTDQEAALMACAELTHSIYDGLDVRRDIRAVDSQKLGDTLLLWNGSAVDGLAVCHYGAGTEAGSGKCYVKFAAARSGPAAKRIFESLLAACEDLAVEERLPRIVGGTNLARQEAYLMMQAHGFRTEFQGVAMQKPNERGYNRSGVYIVDDWR